MNDQYSNLVAKVLANEATTEEKDQLRQYLQANSGEKLVYDQLKEYWDADVQLSTVPLAGFEEKLMKKVLADKERVSTGKINQMKMLLRISSVAASLFFILSSYLYFVHQPDGSHLLTYVAQQQPLEYTLADGSRVKVNKNSSVTISDNFGEKTRNVQLKGEAYFVVEHDAQRPFIVEAGGTKVKVLGTRFNVKEDQNKIITTLVEGSVKFSSDNYETLLVPGEELCYSINTGKYNLYATDVQFNTAWVTGRYTYQNLKFADLLQKLSYIYKMPIEISGSSKAFNKVVSASFLYDEPLADILSALETELNFKFREVQDKMIISPPQ